MESVNKFEYKQDRREFLKTFSVALLSGVAGTLTADAFSADLAMGTLKSAAKLVGVHYGAHNEEDFANTSPLFRALFANQCEFYAPNFTWSSSFPQKLSRTFSWQDPNISFALQNSMRLTGGHIVWHDACPKWFADAAQPEEAISDYAMALYRQYGSKMYSWNPVNEGINVEDGMPGGLRNSPFLKKMGPRYIKVAFEAAKAAAPNVMRVYNDYGMEMDNSYQQKRRDALMRLLDKFQAENIPVDAVGLQSHLRLDGSRFNQSLYSSFLKDISSRGYKILITELDVFDFSTRNAANNERDGEVAGLYKDFLDVALNETAVKTLVTWGISDKYTWLNAKFKHVRKDGLRTRPLLFDENMRQKSAYSTLLNAFKNAPKRQLY